MGEPEPRRGGVGDGLTDDQRAGLRFRLYVDGEVAAEDWLTPGNADMTEATARKHSELANEAGLAGRDWLLEVWDPDHPTHPLRIGPDSLVEFASVTFVVGLPARGRRHYSPSPN